MGRMHEFDGITTNIPDIYSKRIYPDSLFGSGAASNIVVVMGEAIGGIPASAPGSVIERLNIIDTPNQAWSVLEGGDACYASEFFLTPTQDERFNKPSQVIVCNIKPLTRSVLYLQNSSQENVITCTSLRYGTPANQLSLKISNATTFGKKVEIKFKGKNVLEQDDVGYEYFDIQYMGTGTAAILDIDSSTLSTTITDGSEPNTEPSIDNITINLNDYSTLGELVSFIDEHTFYTCSLKGNSDYNPATLDIVQNQDILTESFTATAVIEALINTINTSEEIVAEISQDGSRSLIINDAHFKFFTGGTSPNANYTNWSDALQLLEKFELNHIVVACGDPIVHAMVNEHCILMSGIEEKKYRSAGAGALIEKTKSEKIAEMKSLNSSRFEYFITPFKRLDKLTKTVKTFPPYLGHAMIAGLRYANPKSFDPTFKQINILGVNEEYRRSEKKLYIDAGATLIELKSDGYEVVNNNTTYQGSNLILLTPSMISTVDYITKDMELKIKSKIGALDRAPNDLVIATVENWILTELLPFYKDTEKLLTDDPNNGAKAFDNVSFIVKGDAFELSYRGIVVAPLKFGFITHEFVTVGQK